MISAKSNYRSTVPHDQDKYHWRNPVERLFKKLKNCRRGANHETNIKLWIPFVVEA